MRRLTCYLIGFGLLAAPLLAQGDWDGGGAEADPPADAAREETLQEKIARRRDEARRRALEEMEKKGVGPNAAASSYDPKTDTEIWRIKDFKVPGQSMLGIPVAGGDVAKFYAEVRKNLVPADATLGTKVIFYELTGNILHLAGRGTISKIRNKADTVVVEADIETFRHSRRGVTVHRGLVTMKGTTEVIQLLPGKKPEREQWYMSTKLKGPDTEGWELEQFENFALGQPWKGMTEDALIAMLGPPDQRFSAGEHTSMTYGTGAEMRKFTTSGGRLKEMTVGGM